jgi:hypothetical protein
MSSPATTLAGGGLGASERRDAWWVEPLAIGLYLALFCVYATWAALQNGHYEWGPYLSPFYSPLILVHEASLPPSLSFVARLSPAIFILWIPLAFRGTCYYFRKAYYRAYFMDPPACAVGEARGSGYRGEIGFPFVLQNLHRYTLYLALILMVFLWVDAIKAFNFDGRFGIGVGTLILLADNALLTLYVFSCHSWRHLVGGSVDCFSCAALGKARLTSWQGVSFINRHHMFFAWASLTSVGFADLYIRLVSMGIWSDLRIL